MLETHIAHTPGLTLAASLADGLELLDFLRSQPRIDVLLLDVQMPNLSGLDVLRLLPSAPAVVLTTTRPEFAVEAFELRVTDYLVKPVEYPRFAQAIERVRGRQVSAPPVPLPAAAAPPAVADASIYVKTTGRIVRVPLADILYVEAVGNYAVVITTDKQLITKQPLREIIERLPADQFARIHRSYIINREQIEAVADATVLLHNNRQVPIGRTYLADFLASLSISHD